MEKLQIFDYRGSEVRTVEKDGVTWWVLKDVCSVLDMDTSQVGKVAQRLDEDERNQITVTDKLGREQNTYVVNESGLYNVILRSDKEEAKPFRKWVTSEVLPTIRKHGAYMTDDTIEQVLKNPDFGIKLLTELKEEREKIKTLEVTNKQQSQLIGELKPKADYTDTILQSRALVNINQIAKDYGMSARQMNKILAERCVQYKQGSQWLLYRKYHDKGYTSSETVSIKRSDGSPDVIMRTKWTQKGRLFIYELLKKNDILPVIERKQSIG